MSQVTDAGLGALTRLLELRLLDIAGCVAATERSIGALAVELPRLSVLKLGGCSRVATVTDSVLAALRPATALTHLDLAGCLEVTDAGVLLFMTLANICENGKYLFCQTHPRHNHSCRL